MMKFYTTYYTKNGMGHKRDLLGTHSHMCPEDKPESHKHFIHRVYNPMQFIKQKISRQLWKTAIGKEISLHSALLILEAGTLPESGCWKVPSITADLTWQNDQWLHWAEKSAQALDVFSDIPQPYSSPWNFGTQEEILLFVCVFKRLQTRDKGSEWDRKERRLRQSWSLSCKVMTKLLPFCHHVLSCKIISQLENGLSFACFACL